MKLGMESADLRTFRFADSRETTGFERNLERLLQFAWNPKQGVRFPQTPRGGCGPARELQANGEESYTAQK